MAKKKKHTLDQQPRKRRPKYYMPVPNDELDAYGWALKNVRHPSADDKTIAARPIFNLKQTGDSIKRYGPEVQFLCPTYLELMLDAAPEVDKALQNARASSYAPEALSKLTNAVMKAFDERILVDIAKQFYDVAPMIAQFYAARLAHRDMFGEPDTGD